MELELRHLSPYLPYGLKIKHRNGTIQNIQGLGFSPDMGLIELHRAKHKGYLKQLKASKPILRPLSDLTREIDFNGANIVPIVEIFNLIDESDYVDYYGGLDNPKTQIDDDWNHILLFKSEDGCIEFSYGWDSFWLSVNSEVQLLSNQLDLFNKLFEYQFDVFGLIDKGLAININTLKQFSYE